MEDVKKLLEKMLNKNAVEAENLVQKHFTVNKGRVLIFGDLHLSSTYEGKHKSYLYECMMNMIHIRKIVDETDDVGAVFFLGDLIGVKERNIRDRRFLKEVLTFFIHLNDKTGGNVYSVKGNHDFGDYSDFDLLVGLGILKNPTYVDYVSDNGLEIRFHFVNYGYEDKSLNFPSVTDSPVSASNVILCHQDLQIPGVTNWYTTKDGITLATQKNWSGVDLIIAGHIHTPCKNIMYTKIEGNEVGLFYTGSPSRVAERFECCWYFDFRYNQIEKATDFSAEVFELVPVKEAFYDSDEYFSEESEEDTLDEIRSQALVDVVKEIMDGRVVAGDLFQQIKSMPTDRVKAKDIACKYLQMAIDEVKK